MNIINFEKYIKHKKINDKNKVKPINCLRYAEGNDDYFWDKKSPCIEQVLIKFLYVYDHYLKESDIEVLSEENGVDYNGYNFITKELKVNKYGFKVWITARHQNNWYFYIDEVI